MSINAFMAVQTARQLMREGHTITRASTVAALEYGCDPEDVARLALEAESACQAVRARREQKTAGESA